MTHNGIIGKDLVRFHWAIIRLYVILVTVHREANSIDSDKNVYSQQAILVIVIYHEQRNLYLESNGVSVFLIKEPMKTR